MPTSRPSLAERSAPPWAEQLVRTMDDGFRVPGTNLRFGFDSLLGLLPVGGDALGAVATLSLFYLAVQRQVPRPVLLRMALNVGLDALIGSVPVLGDAFDLVWKANRKNLQLIERSSADVTPRTGLSLLKDRATLAGILLLVVSALLLPFVLFGVLLGYVFKR
jgi:hypothetical protein